MPLTISCYYKGRTQSVNWCEQLSPGGSPHIRKGHRLTKIHFLLHTWLVQLWPKLPRHHHSEGMQATSDWKMAERPCLSEAVSCLDKTSCFHDQLAVLMDPCWGGSRAQPEPTGTVSLMLPGLPLGCFVWLKKKKRLIPKVMQCLIWRRLKILVCMCVSATAYEFSEGKWARVISVLCMFMPVSWMLMTAIQCTLAEWMIIPVT